MRWLVGTRRAAAAPMKLLLGAQMDPSIRMFSWWRHRFYGVTWRNWAVGLWWRTKGAGE
jgi:hypothetical protein